jgi:hypothetical protein
MTETVREAALRPAAAKFYPFLPARMWTAAAHLTELVRTHRGLCAKAAYRANRVLSDAHFMFRGGGEPKTVILELERKVLEAQHNRAPAAAEHADKEKQLSDRRIAVLRAPTAGVQK